MKAVEAPLLKFLQGTRQFVIPIYQRTYSWTLKECRQLWHDIRRAATDESVSAHFVGSVVYVEKGLYQISSVPQVLVIDGQQRLTTISIFLAALGRAIEENSDGVGVSRKQIDNYYLLNSLEDGDLRYKLLLTQTDRETLIRLVDGKAPPEAVSQRISENYRYFEDQIKSAGIAPADLYRGVAKLIIVDIALDRDHDNPQLIFESLNSTGLALSQADLIRNYVLMGQEPKQQEALYSEHWFPMERAFGQADYAALFDRFMRDYLTVKTGAIPNISEVYQSFKAFAATESAGSIEAIVADIHRFAGYFVQMAIGKEPDAELRRAFSDINTLRVDVAYPFLLEVYADYAGGRLSRDDFVRLLRLVESYVFRRAICGIPTNSLNKTFQGLARELDKDRYFESFVAALLLKDSYRRFPRDEEFKTAFQVKDVYNLTARRNYLLRKLENHGRKEPVDVESYTIEHVMPQNENLSPAWQAELGAEWREIQARYLHTIGNLTLTGYNPELSDRPFAEKRDMAGGFHDSPIRLNHSLAKVERWDELAILARAEALSELAARVWPAATLPPDVFAAYSKMTTAATSAYTLADHPFLTGWLLGLFEALRKRVLNLDSSVTEQVLKQYIAFKTSTNFVDIVPQKTRMRLMLNMSFAEIDDPQGQCLDLTGMGRWGNGDVGYWLDSHEQLDYAMFLVRQSYAKHSDGAE